MGRNLPSHAIRGKPLLRYGLVLAIPALLALSVFSASPASAANRYARPSAPRDVTAIAGDNSAIVSFVSPSSNGGSRVTDYYVEEYGRNSAIRRCDSTRCSVLGLSNGVGYRFAVAAVNRFGRSTYSNPSNIVTPTAPVGTTATITFDANGGSGTMASETEPFDTTTTLTLNTFTYSGYTFNDWNSEANGDGTNFTNGELVKFTGSATLYAQWTLGSPNSTVVFNANGGVGSMASETDDVAAALTTNSFTRSGYTFNGWNTAANGSGTSLVMERCIRLQHPSRFTLSGPRRKPPCHTRERHHRTGPDTSCQVTAHFSQTLRRSGSYPPSIALTLRTASPSHGSGSEDGAGPLGAVQERFCKQGPMTNA